MMKNKFVNIIKDKTRKGFTLIELLATIVVITLIFTIGFVLITNLFAETEKIMDDVTEKMILRAAEQYAIEFRNDLNLSWNEEKVDNNSTFCIALESLINYGYFSPNENLNNNYNNDWLIEMNVKNGIYDYKIINMEEASSDCQYYEFQTKIIKNTNSDVEIMENDKKIGNFNYDIIKTDDNIYNFLINFGIDFKVEELIDNRDVYVSLIIDRSVSMANKIDKNDKNSPSRWKVAKNASIEFSDYLIKKMPNAYVSLIQYDAIPEIRREFKQEKLIDSNFVVFDRESADNPYAGGTNTSGGVDLNTALIYKNGLANQENKKLYTILLYDGAPNYHSNFEYYDSGNKIDLNSTSIKSNNAYKKIYFENFLSWANSNEEGSVCWVNNDTNLNHILASSKYLKETGSNLIVVSYDTTTNYVRLKEMATIDNKFCINSNYSKYNESSKNNDNYCYYESYS